jgi:hypothetical protein
MMMMVMVVVMVVVVMVVVDVDVDGGWWWCNGIGAAQDARAPHLVQRLIPDRRLEARSLEWDRPSLQLCFSLGKYHVSLVLGYQVHLVNEAEDLTPRSRGRTKNVGEDAGAISGRRNVRRASTRVL